ncbi:MAG: hypothetical protein AAB919_03645 [Patescibacteria group bacterium]
MNTSGVLGRVWRWIKWPIIVLAVGYVALVGWNITYRLGQASTAEAVAQIHAQKLTLADVEGKNLPPVPDQAENDATVAGIDKNNNGIRDDVELAIFKKYPNSAKIRAAELQYAMTEQMFLTRVFDTGTWKAVAEENGRAHTCIIDSGANRKEVETLTFNTDLRTIAKNNAFEFTTTVGSAGGIPCDVSL